MSKTAIIILVAVLLVIIIVVVVVMKQKAAAATAAAQQNYNYSAPAGSSTQKVNVADVGNFLGGFITGLKTNKDAATATK